MMYDPVSPAPSSKETPLTFLSLGISLIKGRVCQIFGLRQPKSRKRFIFSVIIYHVKYVFEVQCETGIERFDTCS